MAEENPETKLLPHHEAQSLCTTRLPYRQGRKLTAVKVYTVNTESNHLLIFGVPSLSLRQETKTLLSKFGKLLYFTLTTTYPTEPFTENYHAVFEHIQAARIAKKMLDTKNFYGGSLHICYAPELESTDETKNKLFKRHKDVTYRLRNLNKNDNSMLNMNKDTSVVASSSTVQETNIYPKSKINMGDFNVIEYDKRSSDYKLNKNKRKLPPSNKVIAKQFMPCYVGNNSKSDVVIQVEENSDSNSKPENSNIATQSINNSDVEIVDFTSTENEVVTNIDDTLNYDKFGNETIKKIPQKPVNRIKFNVGNKRF